jgi:hypothetical protein
MQPPFSFEFLSWATLGKDRLGPDVITEYEPRKRLSSEWQISEPIFGEMCPVPSGFGWYHGMNQGRGSLSSPSKLSRQQ